MINTDLISKYGWLATILLVAPTVAISISQLRSARESMKGEEERGLLEERKLRTALSELIRDEAGKLNLFPVGAHAAAFVVAVKPHLALFRSQGGPEATQTPPCEVLPLEWTKVISGVKLLGVLDRDCIEVFCGTAIAMMAALRELEEAYLKTEEGTEHKYRDGNYLADLFESVDHHWYEFRSQCRPHVIFDCTEQPVRGLSGGSTAEFSPEARRVLILGLDALSAALTTTRKWHRARALKRVLGSGKLYTSLIGRAEAPWVFLSFVLDFLHGLLSPLKVKTRMELINEIIGKAVPSSSTNSLLPSVAGGSPVLASMAYT